MAVILNSFCHENHFSNSFFQFCQNCLGNSFSSKTSKTQNMTDRDYCDLKPIYSLLAYIYILMVSLILSMILDLTVSHERSNLCLEYNMLSEKNPPHVRNLLNWAIITILFLIKIPKTNNAIIHSIIKRSIKCDIFHWLIFGALCFLGIGKQVSFM